jgi:hypothetical protein
LLILDASSAPPIGWMDVLFYSFFQVEAES